MKIHFLGTGGGRVVTANQLRYTGGFKLSFSNFSIHVDPGPGALVGYKLFSFRKDFKAIFLSHLHLDHVNDVNALIEVATSGCRSGKCRVIGFEEALSYVTPYHAGCADLVPVSPGDELELSGMRFKFTPTRHSAPGVGFLLLSKPVLWYSGDTEITEEHYSIKPEVAVINTLRPWGDHYPGHASSDQVAEWGLNTKPKLIIIQHFGVRMLRAGPEKEARRIEEYAGVRTIAARDGKVIDLSDISSSLLSFV